MKAFEAELRRANTQRGPHAIEFEDLAFQAFYRSSLLKLRRNSSCEIRIRYWIGQSLPVSDSAERMLGELFGKFTSCKLVQQSSPFITVLSRDTDLSVLLAGLDKCSNVVEDPTEAGEALLRIGGWRP